jgi:hypothetical protein
VAFLYEITVRPFEEAGIYLNIELLFNTKCRYIKITHVGSTSFCLDL